MSNTKVQPRDGASRALVLVVDDEETICSSLRSVLEDENFETLTAHDGLDAILKVKSFRPDLVFLDIWMPNSDGIETLELIKQISPDTQVIMISGHATISNALEATKRGAFDFIEKPLGIESVLLCTERALERRAQKEQSGRIVDFPSRYPSRGENEAKTALLSHPE